MNPINDQQLDDLAALADAATPGPWHLTDSSAIVAPLTADEIADVWEPTAASRNGEFIEAAREAVPQLVAEVRRLRAELAEEKATHDPRLRGLLVKAAPDKDLYIQWSTVCDMPGGVFSRETALEYGFPPSRLDHADATGTSSHCGDGAWDDSGFVAEQRGWLRRDRLGDYAVEYLHGDREAAYALLEPFDDEPTPPAARSAAV